MKSGKIKFEFRCWKSQLVIGFVALLLVLHASLHLYVPPIVITVTGGSDSVAVTNNINLPLTCDYISKQKLFFCIEDERLYVEGYAEAIPVGSPYTVEQAQADGGSITVTVDPTYITVAITTYYSFALSDNEQAREHYHDDKPPVYVFDNRKRNWGVEYGT